MNEGTRASIIVMIKCLVDVKQTRNGQIKFVPKTYYYQAIRSPLNGRTTILVNTVRVIYAWVADVPHV